MQTLNALANLPSKGRGIKNIDPPELIAARVAALLRATLSRGVVSHDRISVFFTVKWVYVN